MSSPEPSSFIIVLSHIRRAAPGLLCAAILVGLAAILRRIGLGDGIGLPIFAILLAMIVGNVVRLPHALLPGLRIASRPLLRAGIVLLGMQVTLGELAALGVAPLLALAALVGAIMIVSVWLGERLKVDPSLALLIAAGTSICGASAVMAAASVISAKDEDVAYGVACVTLFGSISMVGLPVLSEVFGLGAKTHGYWAGSSIHEVAQAVAAGFQHSAEAGTMGTVVKLGRVALLFPVLLIVGALVVSALPSSTGRRAPFPLFVVGFIATAAFNSAVDLPATLQASIGQLTVWALAMSLAAIGVQTHFSALLARGARPLILGAVSSILISMIGLLIAVQMFS